MNAQPAQPRGTKAGGGGQRGSGGRAAAAAREDAQGDQRPTDPKGKNRKSWRVPNGLDPNASGHPHHGRDQPPAHGARRPTAPKKSWPAGLPAAAPPGLRSGCVRAGELRQGWRKAEGARGLAGGPREAGGRDHRARQAEQRQHAAPHRAGPGRAAELESQPASQPTGSRCRRATAS